MTNEKELREECECDNLKSGSIIHINKEGKCEICGRDYSKPQKKGETFIYNIKNILNDKKKEPKYLAENIESYQHWKEVGEIDGYNQAIDDILSSLEDNKK